jgi:NAD(P)-dependent dehydrogenase (short-subunit alcohol dehydrogenase family)
MHTIMTHFLTGKVALIAGGAGHTGIGIVRALLQEDATAIVPARSARDIGRLKEHVSGIKQGRLVTLLADYPDYDKAFDMAEDIVSAFGQIDIAVTALDSPAASACLTELAITDWQKMADENITAGFVVGRVVLEMMKKNGYGMYISMSHTEDFEKKSSLALANIAATLQVEMARIFAEGIKGSGIRYHHLFVRRQAADERQVGDFIVQLYGGRTGDATHLFQWPPNGAPALVPPG